MGSVIDVEVGKSKLHIPCCLVGMVHAVGEKTLQIVNDEQTGLLMN